MRKSAAKCWAEMGEGAVKCKRLKIVGKIRSESSNYQVKNFCEYRPFVLWCILKVCSNPRE